MAAGEGARERRPVSAGPGTHRLGQRGPGPEPARQALEFSVPDALQFLVPALADLMAQPELRAAVDEVSRRAAVHREAQAVELTRLLAENGVSIVP